MHCLNMHPHNKCWALKTATEEYKIIFPGQGDKEWNGQPLSLWHNLLESGKGSDGVEVRVPLHEVSVPCCSVFWSSNTSAMLVCMKVGVND